MPMTPQELRQFAAVMRQGRAALHWSAEDLAKKAGVSSSRLLKNSFPPQFDSVPDSLGFRSVPGVDRASAAAKYSQNHLTTNFG
jgi:hypothetical protein